MAYSKVEKMLEAVLAMHFESLHLLVEHAIHERSVKSFAFPWFLGENIVKQNPSGGYIMRKA